MKVMDSFSGLMTNLLEGKWNSHTSEGIRQGLRSSHRNNDLPSLRDAEKYNIFPLTERAMNDWGAYLSGGLKSPWGL